MDSIKIIGAKQGNLKNISLEIPKNKLIVFTGVSGSGKSTLLIDVVFNECQRQYLEAMAMQGIQKPDVERIQGASPAIVITQNDHNRNPRSTVGTLSDVYTDLRMIYEKLGIRVCPYCGEHICAADCKEETEKIGMDFHVYMYCHKCGKKMDKITRTDFSFNTKEGACPTCEGLGNIPILHKSKIVDETLPLQQGAVRYFEKQYNAYQTSILDKAFVHYGLSLPKDKPIQKWNPWQKEILYHGVNSPLIKEHFPNIIPPKTVSAGQFEGVIPILWRRLADRQGDTKGLEEYFTMEQCPDCHGERLAKISRDVIVNDTRLPELSMLSLACLYKWVQQLRLSLKEEHRVVVESYLLDIETKLKRYISVGLGYLSLNRQITTLSGGELQRLRLAATLDSELSGIIYILDEPTAGLHPKDTVGLIKILQKLRDLKNTVLVIEHDKDVMNMADYIIDMGPKSGIYGGKIVAQGTVKEIMQCSSSLTGQYLVKGYTAKEEYRKANGYINIHHACIHNLKDISVTIPKGCLVSVTGPSGSGKSTLVFDVLAKNRSDTLTNQVLGTQDFEQMIEVKQASITKMKRSNVATYCKIYDDIRALFARTEIAKKHGLTAKHFSFNSTGGRCEYCEGLGYVNNNMLFFSDTNITCPKCHGNQFHEDVLAIQYQGHSIKAVLNLSIDEAVLLFETNTKIKEGLQLLQDVGLGYLQLGQSLTTLSGGEGQRIKLAKELLEHRGDKQILYLMDEPTTGLHPLDIEHFLVLLNRLVDAGNTVVVVEHNQQLIQASDWVIDLGKEGGERGGKVMFVGTPLALATSKSSITAKYL